MGAVADVLARQEIGRLDERIAAAQRMMATESSMTDAERLRFSGYITRMQDRRAALDASLEMEENAGIRTDSDMTEARFGNVEATLRMMDDRLVRIIEQIHALDNRQQRSEDRLERMENDQAKLRDEVRSLVRADDMPQFSRVYLIGAAVAVTVIIALLLYLTARML